MMPGISRYAHVVDDHRVDRVVVCTQPAWLHQIVPGGTWVPTGNGRQHAGPGLYWTGPTCPTQFVWPWSEPDPDSLYPEGAIVWHEGSPWVSMTDDNATEPGTGPDWSPYEPAADGPIVAEPIPLL